jgi:hypothetical protein
MNDIKLVLDHLDANSGTWHTGNRYALVGV